MNDPKRILIVFLALVLIVLGVLGIKGLAEDAGYKTQVRYTTAIKAEDAVRFNYAVDSQQGNLLVHGEFKTKNENLVKFEEMKQGFTYVERIKQHYTQHTETYSCGTSKAPRTCTRTYYSWDRVASDEKFAPEIQLYNRTYNANQFNYNDFKEEIDCKDFTEPNEAKGWFSSKRGCDNGKYYLDNNDRYYYVIAPQSFSATFLASSMGGGLNPVEERVISLKNASIDEEMKSVGMYKVWAFWIALIFIIIFTIAAGVIAYMWVMEDGTWSLHD